MSVETQNQVMGVNQFLDTFTDYVLRCEKMSEVEPVMLWSSPGIGKSQVMRQVGDKVAKVTNKKANFIDVRLLLFNPTDLRGIPVPDEKRENAVWLKPQIFQMDSNPNVINILMLDEISAASPTVQAAAYQIVLDRKIGEHKLPDNCLVICAGNRVTDKCVAYKMPKALSDRLLHFDLKEKLDDWKEWAIPRGIDPRIIAYLQFNAKYLNFFEPNSDHNAFPTPRGWEKVNNILSKLPSIEQAKPFIAAKVGKAVCTDFVTYTNVFSRIPNPDLILEGKCKDVPDSPDVAYALVSSLVSKSKGADDKKMNNLLEYVTIMSKEFGALLVKDILILHTESIDKLITLPAFDKVYNKYKNLVEGRKGGRR